MQINEILTVFFLLAGVFFLLTGSIGILRLPDFFSRSHATAKADTLGIMASLLGIMFYTGFTLISFKLLFIIIFVGLANPVGSHALARSALNFGVKPWFNKDEGNKR